MSGGVELCFNLLLLTIISKYRYCNFHKHRASNDIVKDLKSGDQTPPILYMDLKLKKLLYLCSSFYWN